uniref:FAD dependent oxidoreductase domain-containing protein n=1 Tax=Bionectria ochroleuca TaxID=29856 RepID=A0A8H7NI39_BIOOC
MASSRERIVIVGAGIIGLNVALVLAQRGFGDQITVAAEHHPGDTAPSYTSPWAGCNFSAISGRDKNALRWDKKGYAHLSSLAAMDSSKTFVRETESIEYWDDDVPEEKIQDMAEYLKNFQVLSPSELPEGVKFGVAFTTLTLNAPNHLNYLYERLQKEYGVRFVRKVVSDIRGPFSNPKTKIVFNCVGNQAKTLLGVEDPQCYPTRGQVLLARAPHVHTNVMRHGRGYETYIIPRPESNGCVILGGYMQKGNSDSSTYASEADSIIERTTALSPELSKHSFETVAAFSGLRPSREGGARIERTDIDVAGHTRVIVHNYGAGGTGFQAGYGMATESVDTIDDILEQWSNRFSEKL